MNLMTMLLMATLGTGIITEPDAIVRVEIYADSDQSPAAADGGRESLNMIDDLEGIKAFRSIWDAKESFRIEADAFSPSVSFRVDSTFRSQIWRYDPDTGVVAVLSKGPTPYFKVADRLTFNQFLGVPPG